MWGGGESPSLSGLVQAQDIELAGAAVGAVPQGRSAILGEQLRPGDEIVLVASSGLHANGASLARLLAERLPDGYMTELPSGRPLGEALLDPSVMYVPLVQALLESEIQVSYLSHITGHGLLKLMRPAKPLSYRISALPPVPGGLGVPCRAGRPHAHEAYSHVQHGLRLRRLLPRRDGPRGRLARRRARAWRRSSAGSVEQGPRQVIVEPIGVRLRRR